MISVYHYITFLTISVVRSLCSVFQMMVWHQESGCWLCSEVTQYMNILLLIKPITILVAPLYLADTTVAGSQPLPNIIQNIYQRSEHNQSIQRRIKCQWVNKID